MDHEQIELNIVEIRYPLRYAQFAHPQQWKHHEMVCRLHGQVLVLCQSTTFRMQYRYLLESLLNGKISAAIKTQVNNSTSKYDEQFVNGPITS